MPGRKPKPTSLKICENNPGKRKLNRKEPAFTGTPVAPEWMTGEAHVEWQRVVSELAALNMLKSTDQAVLAAYCMSWARWRSAELIIEREGQTVQEPIVNKSGEIVGTKTKRHPATSIAKEERMSLLRSATLFGFDPSSRSKLIVGDQSNDKDPFAEFLNGNQSEENTSGRIH